MWTEICSKLTIKTPELRQWRRSDVFIVDFEHISHLAPVFLFLTLSSQTPAGQGPNFKQKFQVDPEFLFRKERSFTFFTMCKMLKIKNFFSICDQIGSFLRIWPHLLKKSLMKNFIFCFMLLVSCGFYHNDIQIFKNGPCKICGRHLLTLSRPRPLSYRNQSIDLIWWTDFYMITASVLKGLKNQTIRQTIALQSF